MNANNQTELYNSTTPVRHTEEHSVADQKETKQLSVIGLRRSAAHCHADDAPMQ